ncbi:zinc finger MYM-type protein 1-like [Hydra vulgaris]|uniref:Zinc finger MYM-type protein 1-like n=1 Tax=Hydra vulgaris TaxID=6087 RepID=A0ABM4BPU5_HYDVU
MTVSEEFELHNVIHVAHKDSEVHKIDKFSGLYANYSDPATWVVFDDEMRQLLIEHGPKQVDQFDFPKDSMQRKFSKSHYNRRLVNGDEVRRHWLQYSVSNDSLYCFCCKLFTSSTAIASSLSSNGSHDWKNMSAILSGHEKSIEHLANFQSWKEFELRLRNNNTIDAEILKRLIALVRVLGMQNLAFRGTHEKLNTADNGNFLKFVEFLALFDPLMDDHLRKIKDNETHVHYLGKDIQNELIHLLSNAIKQKILKSACDAKYFSIIIDCTPDAGHVEQMTMIIRFLDVISNPKNGVAATAYIKEYFLDFVPLKETTGAGMAETIIKQLGEMSLSIENLRGQGYDNGRNMRGKNKGVQRRILDVNPRALFIPCCAHTLNLAVNDAVKCCLEATAFFDLVQHVYVFFSASTRRWEVLTRYVSNLTVKPLSETRWESRIDALKPLRYQLGDIYDALAEFANDTNLTGAYGNSTRVDARFIANAIFSFEFVVLWLCGTTCCLRLI